MSPISGRIWRQRLRREIGIAALVKLVLLIALWGLFFSPAHRVKPDPATLSHRLGIGAEAP